MLLASNHVWSSPVPNANEPNSALTYYVHYGSNVDRRLRVTAALLTQILSEPAFDTLRTKEQLGYIVGAGMWTAPGDNEAGLRIVVQSERGPVYLEERVEAFLDHMKGVIERMTDEEFTEQKNGLERKWREVTKNLNEEVSRHWAQIDSGYLDFLHRKCLVLLDRNHSVILKQPSTHRHRGRRFFECSQQAGRTVVIPYLCPSIIQDAFQAIDSRTIAEAAAEARQPCRRRCLRADCARARLRSRRRRLEQFTVYGRGAI